MNCDARSVNLSGQSASSSSNSITSVRELLLRVPIARRIRLAVDLAGSRGSVGVAATAETDFDIQRNSTSFVTMRFAIAVDTATLIAAAETVHEPGDVLSVVGPATPDATLAGIAFSLAGVSVLWEMKRADDPPPDPSTGRRGGSSRSSLHRPAHRWHSLSRWRGCPKRR